MRVKFATQSFSRTIAAAIKTICESTKFKNSSAELALSTAQFVEKIDKIFDCLNSGSLYSDNCYRSAIQLNSVAHQFIYFFRVFRKCGICRSKEACFLFKWYEAHPKFSSYANY